MRAARARTRRRVRRRGAAQSPVNAEVPQEEINSAEEQVLENLIILAKEKDASRLQRARERLENVHLEKAIAESQLYMLNEKRQGGSGLWWRRHYGPPFRRTPFMSRVHTVHANK